MLEEGAPIQGGAATSRRRRETRGGAAREEDAREARQARTDAESLRLLYVALTRARDRILVLGRALGKPKTGYEERSWWTVIEETFGRLGDAVRDLDDGVRRFGPDPAVLTSAKTPRTETEVAPDWMTASPSPDPGMRLASPSRMDEARRIPAPTPLATTAGPGLVPQQTMASGAAALILVSWAVMSVSFGP